MHNASQSADDNLVVGVRYLSPRDIVDVMSCGDSLAAGFQTASGYNSHGLQATIALAQRTGRGISYIAHGFPGTVDTDYLADCAQGVSLLQPQVVEFPSDSPNDLNAGVPDSPAIIAAQASMPANAFGMVNTVLGAGSLPVIETPIPFGIYDTAAKYGALRQSIGSIVRNSSARAVTVLDAQAIISGYVLTPGNLQVLPASCMASDNNHLNDACQTSLGQAEAALLAPALR